MGRMKQHITIEQLKELSKKQKKRLQNWWVPVEGDHFITQDLRSDIVGDIYIYSLRDDWNESIEPNNKSYPLLSIGQMIEFIGDDWTRSLENCKGYVNTTPDELCDALWDMIKQLLNETTHN